MRRPLNLQIGLFAIIRMIFNTTYRMIYPFLTIFGVGLGADLRAISLALTNRSLVGALGPFLAVIADRRGRKIGMLLGMGIFASGLVIMIIWPSYPAFVAMLLLTTLGKYGFDPAMQAYLGDRIPYRQRGLALSVTELGWSLSFFLGIPAIGLIINKGSWRSPFGWLLIASVLVGGLLFWLVPRDTVSKEKHATAWSNLRSVFSYPPALAGLAMGLSATIANEVINLVFGVWMEDAYNLKILALGGTAAVIGVAEFGAEALVGALADRLGKVRAIGLGLIANSIAALAFPLLGHTLIGAEISLFLFFITFEFMLVSSIPLMTEVMPGARAALMAFNVAGLSLGRAVGDLIGPSLYAWGIGASAAAAIVFNGFALLALQKMHKSTGKRLNAV